ncbi:MAG: 2-(1,2-epoxy-1,2-dihydrophenyl)acetyl-CoA isomerase, partial [Paracoccaceae bacterium]
MPISPDGGCMDYQTITVELNDGLAVLTLNRPDKMNALT